MSVFVAKAFSGIAPRKSAVVLQPYEAQIARNCVVLSGEIRTLNAPSLVITPTGSVASIYRFDQTYAGDDKYWFTFANHTYCVRGQVAADTTERTFYTDGINPPRATDNTLATASGGAIYPANYYNLGLPAPLAAPTVAPVTSAVQGTIAVTGAQATVTTTGNHPFVVDDVVTVPTTGDVRVTTVADATHFTYNVPGGATTPAGTVTIDYKAAPVTRAYIYTYVNSWHEEGPPSPAATLTLDNTAMQAALSGMAVAPTGAYNVISKRIYRSLTGSADTQYQFVAEIPVANTTFTDSVKDKDLAEICPSITWIAPPADMTGILTLPNGIYAGFSGNDVCFSDAWHPHAWPIQYQQSTTFPIVGMGAFATSLVVCTTGNPYLITGSDPLSMSMAKMELDQQCLSQQSIVGFAGEVIYAGPGGLVSVGPGGARIATEAFMTRDEWQQFKPSSIKGFYWDRKYIGFYDNGTTQAGFIFDPANNVLTEIDLFATAGFYDLPKDTLYLLIGGNIEKWEGGAAMTYTWHSKLFSAARPCNLACGVIDAANYPVNFSLIVDGVQKYSGTISSQEPFRLPGGYIGRNFEFEVSGTASGIRNIAVSESMLELAEV